ncbi:amidase [Vibrio sp. WXL103]|uniref:amidase n=1 Tax=Vibrio sp. WXL103 TaxID=3450710 RepID=UPI003EC4AC1A
MKRRDFFKTVGAGAASAVVLSHPLSKAMATTIHKPESNSTVLDGIGMAELVRDGKATPKELAQEAIAKVKATNKQINAVVTETFDRALQHADNINKYAPFAGVPFLIKDCVDVAGVRSTNGSKLTANNVPRASAAIVESCERAGFNIIGMSHSPEFTASPSTESILFGATKNPWDLSLSPGGSTGGGAAAIAAGYVPVCHATDGGGSARMPASACGIFGYKPSRELLISGSSDGSDDFIFTHQTFMSRTVRDTALAAAVNENHLSASDYPRTPLGYVNTPLRKKLKIGVTLNNFFGQTPDIETQNAITSSVKLLEELGHTVIDCTNPINGEEFYSNYFSIFASRLAALGKMVENSTGKPLEESGVLGWQPVGMIREYEQKIAANPDFTKQGYEYMERLILEHNHQFFSDIDVWLTPVTLTQTPKSSYFDPNIHSDYEEHVEKAYSFMSYTPVQNVAGNAAISVPLYWTKAGIPIGSMLSAPRGHDRLLFELAYQLEQARPWANKTAPHYL